MPIQIRFGPRRNHSTASAILGALICLALCGTGLLILLSGAELSGGIPLLPDVLNRGIGRALLLGGTVVTGLLGLYATREAWRLQHHKG